MYLIIGSLYQSLMPSRRFTGPGPIGRQSEIGWSAYIISAPASARQIFSLVPFSPSSSTYSRPHSNQPSVSSVLLPSISFIDHTSIIAMSSASLLSAKVASMAAATSAKAAGRSAFKLANSQRGVSGELPLPLISSIAPVRSLITMIRPCSLHLAIVAHSPLHCMVPIR